MCLCNIIRRGFCAVTAVGCVAAWQLIQQNVTSSRTVEIAVSILAPQNGNSAGIIENFLMNRTFTVQGSVELMTAINTLLLLGAVISAFNVVF